MQRYVVGGVFLASGVVSVHGIVVGCSEPAATSYGNPNTLDRKNLPGEGGVEPLNCGGGGGDGGGGGADAGCPTFRKDIFPLIQNTGPWKCSEGPTCHATVQQPIIKIDTAENCLVSLQQAKVLGRPYAPSDGNRDPSQTTILCNIQGTCGSPMPKPPVPAAKNDDLCKLEAWIKCGSPLD